MFDPWKLDCQHKTEETRFATDSSIIPVIVVTKPVYDKKNHKNNNTKGDPEGSHLIMELVRTQRVAVVHFSSTSVGFRIDLSTDSHPRQASPFGLEGRGLQYKGMTS